MKLKSILAVAVLTLLPLAAQAAPLYIPVSGTGPGANFSSWQTEVTLHNTGSTPISIALTFHDANGAAGTAQVTVAARSTISLADVVKTKFGRESATGAIEITPQGDSASRLTITSRTLNKVESGEYGHDTPVLRAEEATQPGDLAVIAGPSDAIAARFNFGVYSIDKTTVKWELIRADGTVASTKEVEYLAGTQRQYNYGATAPELFALDAAANNDVVHATVLQGSAFFYGAIIDQKSGDPTYVPGIRTRPEFRFRFIGVDLDEDGTVDLRDADHNGILDQPLEAGVGLFANYFRVVAEGPLGEPVSYAIVSSTAYALLTDELGTVQMAPGPELRGTSGTLAIRVFTRNGEVEILTIPVLFK
ncbi:MAG: hypothetical protein JJE51_07720 [Thermoanaerobaculia bacterium]|nr:hypothetical protein [Thermoanaerobaculia bacterium]